MFDADDTLLGIVDCWVDGVAMVWEIESTEWHLSPLDHDYTVERAALFTAAGAAYTATKPRKMRLDERTVIEQLKAIHAHATARPRPPLRAERAC